MATNHQNRLEMLLSDRGGYFHAGNLGVQASVDSLYNRVYAHCKHCKYGHGVLCGWFFANHESPTYWLGVGWAGSPVAKDQYADRCCDEHGQMEQENDDGSRC